LAHFSLLPSHIRRDPVQIVFIKPEHAVMDSETFLIVEVLGGVGGFSILMLYAAARILSLRSAVADLRFNEPGAKLPAVERPILMPVHLTTTDEMVDWMINDLPKLTAKVIEADRA
jgi:hypothetical protein